VSEREARVSGVELATLILASTFILAAMTWLAVIYMGGKVLTILRILESVK
jgi:hypothetical protein